MNKRQNRVWFVDYKTNSPLGQLADSIRTVWGADWVDLCACLRCNVVNVHCYVQSIWCPVCLRPGTSGSQLQLWSPSRPVRVSAAVLDSATQKKKSSAYVRRAVRAFDDKTLDGPTGKNGALSDVHAPENICPAPVVIAGLPRLCICKSVHASGRCAAASW